MRYVRVASNPPGQVIRPVALVSAGAWQSETGGSPDPSRINETFPDDATYVQSSFAQPTADESKYRLGPAAATPKPRTTGEHRFTVRERKNATGGDTVDLTVNVYRADAVTLVGSRTFSNIDPLVEVTVSLTGTEADTIPDADFQTGLVVGLSSIKV